MRLYRPVRGEAATVPAVHRVRAQQEALVAGNIKPCHHFESHPVAAGVTEETIVRSPDILPDQMFRLLNL